MEIFDGPGRPAAEAHDQEAAAPSDVPLADSTIWEMEQRGQFPRRFLLTPRCVVWDLAEVEAWLALRRAKPIRRAPPPDVRKRITRPVRAADRNEGRPFPG